MGLIDNVQSTPGPRRGAAAVIRLRLFARLSEISGRREMKLELDDGTTVRDAYLRLCHLYPEMARFEGRLMYAVNADYSTADHMLRDGDELTLVPPVSGG
jgi:MoaE-MoaD fusion protein